MLTALTHEVPPSLAKCELSYLERRSIDYDMALVQHAAYRQALADCGAQVRQLDCNLDHPDGAFVEDTAIVLDQAALLTSMGVASRRAEVDQIASVLTDYRTVHRVAAPATIEGGDVLLVGRTFLVGLTERTNREGVEALATVSHPLGYEVVSVEVQGCLHFKSACTALDDETLLVNREWFDPETLSGWRMVDVDAKESFGANALPIGERVLLSASHPRTADKVAGLGFNVQLLDISEFEKAEAALTCLSLLIEHEE